MMNPVPWLQMTNMISYQGLVRTFLKQNLFAALFLCTLTGHAFAATEIHKPDNNLEQLSKVSMSTHNSNPAGVESQIKEKAEELQASNYYISSFSGKNYIHATVIFYK